MPPSTLARRQSVQSADSSDTASSFIDLTDSPGPSASNSRRRTKRRLSQRESREGETSQESGRSRSKRARRGDRLRGEEQGSGVADGASLDTWDDLDRDDTEEVNSRARNEIINLDEVQEVDLTNDGFGGLGAVMQRQRADQIAAQKPQEDENRPLRFGSITCVICMDSPTDLTATSCGHVFCHTCLMEALIAGENRSGPGETKKSQCPVCRKNVSRKKTSDIIPLLLKKGLATQPRRRAAVG